MHASGIAASLASQGKKVGHSFAKIGKFNRTFDLSGKGAPVGGRTTMAMPGSSMMGGMSASMAQMSSRAQRSVLTFCVFSLFLFAWSH